MNHEAFTPIPLNDGQDQLLVPYHVAHEDFKKFMTKSQLSVTGQEMAAQREVMGTDGHGSIRVEKSYDPGTPPPYTGDFGKEPKKGGRYGKNGKDVIQDDAISFDDVAKLRAKKANRNKPGSQPNPDQDPDKKVPGTEIELYKKSGEIELYNPDSSDNLPELSKIDPEFEQINGELAVARERYAQLCAERSGVVVFGRKGRKHFGDREDFDAAKTEYDRLRRIAGQYAGNKLREKGDSKEVITVMALGGALQEDELLTSMIVGRQKALNEGKNKIALKFYDWWARQGGTPKGVNEQGEPISRRGRFFRNLKGSAAKAGAMWVIGLVPGVIAGAAGTVVAGPVVGGLLGGAVARGIARGLTGAKINKEAESLTVGAAQGEYHSRIQRARLAGLARDLQAGRDIGMDATDITPEFISNETHSRIEQSVSRNRKRMAKSIGIGAIGGAMGTLAGDFIGDHIWGAGRSLFGGHHGGGHHGGGHNGGGHNGGHKTGTGNPRTPDSIDHPGAMPNDIPQVPQDLAPVGENFRHPWNYFANKLGAEKATPSIKWAAAVGDKYGIHVVGHGGGGLGRVDSVTMNGMTFTDNGHINAALQYIMDHEGITA